MVRTPDYVDLSIHLNAASPHSMLLKAMILVQEVDKVVNSGMGWTASWR